MGDIRAILIKPNTQSKKVNTSPFICSDCGMSYSKREYKILYDSQKLVYFLLFPNWKNQKTRYQLCHDCFSKNIKKICEEYELPVLHVRVKDGRSWVILDFLYGMDDGDEMGPLDPSDMGIF